MTTLWITRGLPASGKTTWARSVLASRPQGRIIRLNRDDLRRMGLADGYRRLINDAECRITTIRDAALTALLRDCDVIVDDTNLCSRYVRDLMSIATKVGVQVEIKSFLDVPLEECIRRDAAREEPVGEQVIRSMHARYLAGKDTLPTPVPPVPVTPRLYVAQRGAPRAILDVDGTIALLDRNPYDESDVSADRPSEPVIAVVRALADSGYAPVFMSGRTEKCRVDTVSWIRRHVLSLDSDVALHMRKIGDNRPDHVVKLELFDTHVRDLYDVRLVLDDRSSVVALWRSLGLVCLQVAPGDF